MKIWDKILHAQTSNFKGSADCILLTSPDNTKSCQHSLKSRLLGYYTRTAKVLPNTHTTWKTQEKAQILQIVVDIWVKLFSQTEQEISSLMLHIIKR